MANVNCEELFEAVEEGDLQRVKYLVEIHQCDVNIRDKDGNTPLHLAAWYGYLDIVKFLVEHGADVNARNAEGNTPLHLAIMGMGKTKKT
ncbi:MAG: ankyrin repeat domain-containing protein [Thermoprotei archaeon]